MEDSGLSPAPVAAAALEGGGWVGSQGSPLPEAWELTGCPPQGNRPESTLAASRDLGRKEAPSSSRKPCVREGSWALGGVDRGGRWGHFSTSALTSKGDFAWTHKTKGVVSAPLPERPGGATGSYSAGLSLQQVSEGLKASPHTFI